MIEITPSLSIEESELSFDYIRSAGPGGQNVNKVSTAVQMRFDLEGSSSLPEDVKSRLHSLARNRITEEGVLIIEAHRFRTQEQNRADALARLVALIQQASEPPKPRKKTRPSAAARAKRVDEKRQRGVIKQMRRSSPHPEE
jgi:ribosome-associated protein